MADSNASIGKVVTTSTTFVEKCIEYRHCMLLISFILALDSSLVIFFKKGLLDAFSSLTAPEVSAGNALVFLALFAFLMALLFPTLRQILLLVPAFFTNRSSKQIESDPDWRGPISTRRQAIINRDKVVLELLDKYEAEQRDVHITMDIGFAMVMLFVINFLVLGDAQIQTLSQTAAALRGTLTGFWLSALVSFCLGGFVIFCLFTLVYSLTPERDSRIYLPETPEEQEKRMADEDRRRLG